MTRHPRRLLAMAAALGLLPASMLAQQCPAGRATTGDLGFQWLHCTNGGPCWMSEDPGNRWFDLTNAPRVRMIDPAGPAAGILRDGDILIAIDGKLTTSVGGGRLLANLVPGRATTLIVQRGAGEMTTTIVSRPRCGMIGLAVNSLEDSASFARSLSDPRSLVARVADSVNAGARARSPFRRSTPQLDLEVIGEPPLVTVDSVTGRVTLVFRNSRVTIAPRRKEDP